MYAATLSRTNAEKQMRRFTQKIPNFVVFSTLQIGKGEKKLARDCSIIIKGSHDLKKALDVNVITT